jgi:hypothetical protein
MKFKLRKLGSAGHFHLSIAAILIVVGVGLYGVYQLVASHADSLNSVVGISSEEGCYLAGRVWNSTGCTQHCRNGNDSLLTPITVNGTTRKYCKGAVNTNIDQNTCVNGLHRRYVSNIGCSKRLDGDNTNNARQCVVGFPYYVATDGTTDYCKAPDAPPPPPPPAEPDPIDPADSSATANKPGINTSEGCYLAGRIWGGAECTQTCRSANSTLTAITKNGVTRKYCTNAITTGVSEDACLGYLHRKYVANIGCARRMDKDNTNNARQCQAAWPNYVANASTDYCQAPQVTPTTGDGDGGTGTGGGGGTTTGGGGTTTDGTGGGGTTTGPTGGDVLPPVPATPVNVSTSDKLGQKRCEQLLGRVFNDKQNVCDRVCRDNSGHPVAAAAPYNAVCNRAISADLAQNVCTTNLHRVWLGSGCARRFDQKDIADAPQCLPGFPYYNTNFASKVRKTGVDVCEQSETIALLHEKNNQLGDPALSVAWGAGGNEGGDGGGTVVPPQPKDATTVKVERGVSEENCALMGREWIPDGQSGDVKVAGGCSLESCFNKDVSLQKANDSVYCIGYISRITHDRCTDTLHRKWLSRVDGCAQKFNQDKKAGSRAVGAKECTEGFSTYVFRDDDQDICLKPGVVDRLKAVASATGTPFVALAGLSKAGVCNVQPHMHWNGHECVKDRDPIPTTTTPTGDSDGGGTSGGGGSTSPTFMACPDFSAKVQAVTCPHVGVVNNREVTTCSPSTYVRVVGSGGTYYTNACKSQAATANTPSEKCNADGGYWNGSSCLPAQGAIKVTFTAQASCEAVGGIYKSGECLGHGAAPSPQAVCLAKGYHWVVFEVLQVSGCYNKGLAV